MKISTKLDKAMPLLLFVFTIVLFWGAVDFNKEEIVFTAEEVSPICEDKYEEVPEQYRQFLSTYAPHDDFYYSVLHFSDCDQAILLVADEIYRYKDATLGKEIDTALDIQVFGYRNNEVIEIGYLTATNQNYPISYNDTGFYIADEYYVKKCMIDDAYQLQQVFACTVYYNKKDGIISATYLMQHHQKNEVVAATDFEYARKEFKNANRIPFFAYNKISEMPSKY